jgi:hypothetical protein
MTPAWLAATPVSGPSLAGTNGSDYQPGRCNIGPAEIARRRRAGHVGLAATAVLFGGLVAGGAPPLARIIVVLPPPVLRRLRVPRRVQLRLPRPDRAGIR